MMFWRTSLEVLTVLTSASWVASHPTKRSTCTAEAIQCPSLFGAEILNVNATEHYDEVVPVGSLANLTVSYCGVDMYGSHQSTFGPSANKHQALTLILAGTTLSMFKSGYRFRSGMDASRAPEAVVGSLETDLQL